MFVVPAGSPYQTLADLLAAARAKPGAVTVSSGGTGTPTHIGFEVLKRAAGVDMIYVPFAGAAPAVNALLGGHITAVYSDYTTVAAQLKAGVLRPLAIGSLKRFAGLPDVPTVVEAGYKDYEAESWNGILAPAKTPKDTLTQLASWFAAAGESPALKQRLASQGLYPNVLCGAEYSAALRRQYERYGDEIRASNIKAE